MASTEKSYSRSRSSYSYGDSGDDKIKRFRPIGLVIVLLFLGGMWMIHAALDRPTDDSLKKGYFRDEKTTYYYSGSRDYHQYSQNIPYVGEWFIYRENGWKRTLLSRSEKKAISYKGENVDPSWGCTEIAFPTKNAPDGYYRYNGKIYFCQDYSSVEFDPSRKKWVNDNGRPFKEIGFPYYDKDWCILLSPEPYYLGTVYDPKWGGYEPRGLIGYYRFRNVTYYNHSRTSTDDWYIYDGGWKKSSYPVANYNSYYVGRDFLPEWEGSEIRFYDTPYEGYYLYNKEIYYYNKEIYSIEKTGWFVFRGEWESISFPRYDEAGYIILSNDYYKGEAFDPEWDGYEYPMTAGYYRYQGVTYYGLEDRTWYRYDHGWRSTGCPVGNFSAYYQGNAFQRGWDGEPFHDVCYDRLKAGYYRLDGVTYYLVKTLPSSQISGQMYRYSGGWVLYDSRSPLTDGEGCEVDLNDYYMGADYRPEWGGSSYPLRDGYYLQNGTTYFAQGNSWYSYQEGIWTSSSGPDGDVNDYYEGRTVSSSGGVKRFPLDAYIDFDFHSSDSD